MMQSWELECYEKLRTEIVKQAVMDLKKALRKSDRIGCVCDEQTRIEAWFLSKWGQMLSGDNGELIIEKCRKTYKKRSGQNGKLQSLPEDVQKQIYTEYMSGVKSGTILGEFREYGLTNQQLLIIVRRWEQ